MMVRTRAGMAMGALVALVAAAATASATTFWVAPDGGDGNPGTIERPWATPGFASRQLRPGDTLIVRGGTYRLRRFDEDIVVPGSGAPGAWITIRGEEGITPVLAGGDNLFAAVILDGVEYVRLENLEITHDAEASGEAAYFRTGVSMSDRPCAHVVLADLYVHHVDEGALDARDVDDLLVTGCRFEHCGFGGIGGPAGVAGGLRNLVVRGCTLSYSGHYYRGGDGSDRPYDRPDGFGIEPSAGPILIEDTVAEHNYGDGLDSKAAGTTIRRCTVANNSCDGVKLWGGGTRVENTVIYGVGDGEEQPRPWGALVIGTEQPGAAFEIVNVTIDDALGNPGYLQIDNAVPIDVLLRNSIVRSTGTAALTVGAAVRLAVDHVLFFFPNRIDFLAAGATWYTAATVAALGVGCAYGDPLLVRPAWGSRGDYHLTRGSPAVDAGTTLGAPVGDVEGRARDAHPDLGAYELSRPRLRLRLAAAPRGN